MKGLDTIKILYRACNHRLWGIPHEMRPRQQPSDIDSAWPHEKLTGDFGWIDFGFSLHGRDADTRAFLEIHRDTVPGNAFEWAVLENGIKCPECDGSGEVITAKGFSQESQTCTRCWRRGTVDRTTLSGDERYTIVEKRRGRGFNLGERVRCCGGSHHYDNVRGELGTVTRVINRDSSVPLKDQGPRNNLYSVEFDNGRFHEDTPSRCLEPLIWV